MLIETLIFYCVLGIAVATAVAVFYEDRPVRVRVFLFASAVLFWPIYLPVVLTAPRTIRDTAPPKDARVDELGQMISRTEEELAAALGSLDGWAEEAFARQSPRIGELYAYWKIQADRIREMDQLLARYGEAKADGLVDSARRESRSERARLENIQRIRTVRDRTHRDLLDTLAWVRELVSMIHLAKFSGAPASRAEELVSQIAAAVEGLSEVSQWNGAVAGSPEVRM